jgi:hypothetical protein
MENQGELSREDNGTEHGKICREYNGNTLYFLNLDVTVIFIKDSIF